MNIFELDLEKKFGVEPFHKLRTQKIGIAGCGGLGSNCAHLLVRSGIIDLLLVDHDVIDPSNINRQFYFYDQIGLIKTEALKANLMRINPSARAGTLNLFLDKTNIADTFKECSIVIEALDDPSSKSILASSLLKEEKIVISVSGIAGFGNSDSIITRKIKDNFYLIGDLVSDISLYPPLAPRVNVAAAKQADIVLEILLTGIKD